MGARDFKTFRANRPSASRIGLPRPMVKAPAKRSAVRCTRARSKPVAREALASQEALAAPLHTLFLRVAHYLVSVRRSPSTRVRRPHSRLATFATVAREQPKAACTSE